MKIILGASDPFNLRPCPFVKDGAVQKALPDLVLGLKSHGGELVINADDHPRVVANALRALAESFDHLAEQDYQRAMRNTRGA